MALMDTDTIFPLLLLLLLFLLPALSYRHHHLMASLMDTVGQLKCLCIKGEK